MCICVSFLLNDQIMQFMAITMIYFPIHLLTVVWVVSTVLSVVNRAAVNIHVQIFAWTDVFSFPEYIPKSIIAESNDNSVFTSVRIAKLLSKVTQALWFHQHCVSSNFSTCSRTVVGF